MNMMPLTIFHQPSNVDEPKRSSLSGNPGSAQLSSLFQPWLPEFFRNEMNNPVLNLQLTRNA